MTSRRTDRVEVAAALIVLVIALVVLGPKRLPEVGRSFGQGISEFKDSVSGVMDHDEQSAPMVSPAKPSEQV